MIDEKVGGGRGFFPSTIIFSSERVRGPPHGQERASSILFAGPLFTFHFSYPLPPPPSPLPPAQARLEGGTSATRPPFAPIAQRAAAPTTRPGFGCEQSIRLCIRCARTARVANGATRAGPASLALPGREALLVAARHAPSTFSHPPPGTPSVRRALRASRPSTLAAPAAPRAPSGYTATPRPRAARSRADARSRLLAPTHRPTAPQPTHLPARPASLPIRPGSLCATSARPGLQPSQRSTRA